MAHRSNPSSWAWLVVSSSCAICACQDPGTLGTIDAGRSLQVDARALRGLDASPGGARVDVTLAVPDAAQGARDAAMEAATPQPLLLGLNPSEGANPVLTDLEVLALGARATTVAYRWGGSTSLAEALERAQRFADAGVSVQFSIDIVRGFEPLYPSGGDAAGAGTPADLLDEIFARRIPFAAIAIGEALDLALAGSSAVEASALSEVVTGFLSAAQAHPNRLAGTLVALHTTAGAWSAPQTELVTWLAQAEALAISWFAVDANGRATDSVLSGNAFDAMLDEVALHGRPVLVRELAYPSATVTQGSPERQDRFFAGALKTWRARGEVGWLAVSSLDDPQLSDCESYAEDFGLRDIAVTARCSIGLRDASGVARPAYHTIIDAIAETAVP